MLQLEGKRPGASERERTTLQPKRGDLAGKLRSHDRRPIGDELGCGRAPAPAGRADDSRDDSRKRTRAERVAFEFALAGLRRLRQLAFRVAHARHRRAARLV